MQAAKTDRVQLQPSPRGAARVKADVKANAARRRRAAYSLRSMLALNQSKEARCH